MRNQNGPDDITSVNPADHAEEIRSQAFPVVDHLLDGENGQRMIPDDAHYREEHRATNVGHAAGHVSYGSELADDVRPHQAQYAALEAELAASEPRRDLAEQFLGIVGNLVAALMAVPNNSIDPARKKLANAAKALLLTGDTAIVGAQLWRAGGMSLWLALVIGMSLAGSVIAIGSVCGHQIAAAHQRKERGPVPDGSPHVVRSLHDNGLSDENHLLWLRLAFIAAGVMVVSLFLLGHGSGDPAPLALGYATLGVLTVGGSAAAQAYATNDAAAQLDHAEHRLEKCESKLREFESNEYNSASAGTHAVLLERAARHRALATATTITSIANRLPDTPEIGGYVDGRHIPVASVPPAPVNPEPETAPAAPDRSRRRPRYRLTGDLVPETTGEVMVRGPAAPFDVAMPDLPPIELSPERPNGSRGEQL